jgi:hypothetical protein
MDVDRQHDITKPQVTLTWESTVRYTVTVPETQLVELLRDDDADDYLLAGGTLDLAALEGGTAGRLDDYLSDLEFAIDLPDCPAESIGTTDRAVEAVSRR